jgi:hypothetical protein
MAAPTMRRLLPFLLAFLGLLSVPNARAQDAPAVRLTLLSQTAWNSTFDPVHGRELALRFRAENLGTAPIGELSIGLTLYGRVATRTAYEASLGADPAFVIKAETRAREGTLDPGVPRDFELTFQLDETAGLDPDDSGIYPLKIDLRTGLTSVAAIRTPVLFLVREPEEPLALSWTFVLHHPIAVAPDGTFSDDLELALEPGGRIGSQIAALSALAADPAAPAVDVAVSPLLLTQLAAMRDGYRVSTETGARDVAAGQGGALLAERALEAMRELADATNVRVTALPFASPELPALLSGGLGRDVDVQIDLGRQVVADLLETTPVTSVLRPPGAALDEATLEELSGSGISTLVAGPATVEPSPQPLGFVGPPAATLGPEGEFVALVPEPSLMAVLQSSLPADDPVLAAQVVLGELATIWQELPGQRRGVTVVLSEDLELSAAFYGPFSRIVSGAPWLDPAHASEFALEFAPPESSALSAPSPRSFGSTYVAELRQARRRVDTYRSMLAEPSDRPDRLDETLLLAESRQFLSNPDDGLAFIASVQDAVGSVFRGITVDSADEITLASSAGAGIPVAVGNTGEEAVLVNVRLLSNRLRETPSIELELAPGDVQNVTFRVDVRSTGRFQVLLQVVAPGGRLLVERPLTVRSTVYNRIALVITIVAAAMLLALWARRFLPSRTS